MSIWDWLKRRREPKPVYPEPPSFAWWVGADLIQYEQGALRCTNEHIREAIRRLGESREWADAIAAYQAAEKADRD